MRTMLLAVLALALAGCGGKTATPAATGDIAAWVGKENVAVVERQQLKIGPAISGTLEAERRAMVRAELGATVVQIQAEAGQTVSQGTVLARLDDAAIRDAYESSKAGVRSAELNAEIARRELERAQALVAAGAIADRDVETARLAETSAESQLAEARSRLAAAEKQLHRTVIRAPFGGVVSERPVSLGDVVQPGTILFTIVDPASLKFEGAVSTEELGGLKVGAAVEFTVAGIGVLEGRVIRINPSVDPATRQARLTVGVPNAGGRLLAGLFAEGRVATSRRSSVVAPSGAVDRRGIRPFVVRLKGGRVERVEVLLGLIDEAREQMEIQTGLAAGDTLLLGGARGLQPGTMVRVGSPAELTGSQAASVPAKE